MSGPWLAVLTALLALLTAVVGWPRRFARRFPEDDLVGLLRSVGGDRGAARRLAELERTADPSIDDAIAVRRARLRLQGGRR